MMVMKFVYVYTPVIPWLVPWLLECEVLECYTRQTAPKQQTETMESPHLEISAGLK